MALDERAFSDEAVQLRAIRLHVGLDRPDRPALGHGNSISRRRQKAIVAPANSTEVNSSGAARVAPLKEFAAEGLDRIRLFTGS